ncbi:MAG: hypothetical protein Q7J68_01925 [Thermoplasmata archaeon]|nr:hypothetical protein [Thermoplasmata archaeon]
MNVKSILLALALASLLCLNTSAATVQLPYGTHQISITLQPNEDLAYLIPLELGDRLIVNLAVAEGGPVDFYLTNLTAYNLYKASVSGDLNFPSLYYLTGQTSENAIEVQYSYDSLVKNELVVLIDNSVYTENGAAPIGPVTVTGEITVERNVWTFQNIAITIAVVVIIILFMAYLKWPTNRG